MKPGRNDPCPCGSGKKYKLCCHGNLQARSAFKSLQQQEEPNRQEIGALVSVFNQQRYIEAERRARLMTESFPHYGFGWLVLGAASNRLGRGADALAALQKAATMMPRDEEVHYNLGSTFHNLGRLDKAAASYRRALALKPDYVEAHNNLGNTLKDRGLLNEAATSYLRALQLKPDYAEAPCNLGNTLKELGRMAEAEASLRHALQIRPDFVEALNSLALLLNTQGEPAMALDIIHQSMQHKETPETKSIFVACAKHLRCTSNDSVLRAAMVRALTEPWGRPSELAQISASLVKLDPDTGGCVTRAASAWPVQLSEQDLFGTNGLAALASDTLLCALLDAAPICDIEMERFLTMARCALLEAATGLTAAVNEAGEALGFYSALARQCFINEYVFAHTDEELRKAAGLRDSLAGALEADARIPALWPVAVAAYFPLCSLSPAARLLERPWPEEVATVLQQQVREPAQEQHIRATIPRLTDIEDEVSLRVQQQYEDNPYPRWIKAEPAAQAKDISGYLRQKFPLASFKHHGKSGSINVLVAGCGTGQHSVATARRIRDAQVLAVDLSMNSLAYAKRKTQELGITSIEYAQADLLKLGSLERSFDVIESVGVLHHLADPWAGWQILLSLLRPGGFMELGFYSEVARRDIVRIWDFIDERGYGSSANDIRQFRQDLMEPGNRANFGMAFNSVDFFSTSSCRDLLFHVHEHRMTLAGIAEFLRKNKLAFLGFETDTDVLKAYRLRFPDDHAASNLEQWQIFEHENPDTFSSMYHFWTQKPG